jgi:hypothetical protein
VFWFAERDTNPKVLLHDAFVFHVLVLNLSHRLARIEADRIQETTLLACMLSRVLVAPHVTERLPRFMNALTYVLASR